MVYLGKVKMSQGSLSLLSALNLRFAKWGDKKVPPPVGIGLRKILKPMFLPSLQTMSKSGSILNFLK